MRQSILKMTAILIFGLGFASCEDLTEVENNIPTIVTGEVSNVKAHEATIAIDGTDYAYYYVELSTSSAFAAEATQHLTVSGTSLKAIGLRAGTVYYYRQCATDGLTVVTGPTRQFETVPEVSVASILLAPWNQTVGSEDVTDRTIGLFFSAVADGTDYSGLANYQTRYDVATQLWQFPAEITPPAEAHRFYAYAPYVRTLASKRTVPIDVSKENIDYLMGVSDNITLKACNANITMRHALARVVFSLTKDADSNADVVLREYALCRGFNSDLYLPLSGALDLVTQTITASFSNEYWARTLPSPITLSADAVALEFYAIPVALSDGDVEFMLNYNFGQRVAVPASTWRSGYQFTYPVTVRQNQLEIGDVQVTPWQDTDGPNIVINN